MTLHSITSATRGAIPGAEGDEGVVAIIAGEIGAEAGDKPVALPAAEATEFSTQDTNSSFRLSLQRAKSVFCLDWLERSQRLIGRATSITSMNPLMLAKSATAVIAGPLTPLIDVGCDALRYYVLVNDQDFELLSVQNPNDGGCFLKSLIQRTNSDLANDWGNLVNRSISMTRKYFPDQVMKAPERVSHSVEIRAKFESLPADLLDTLDKIDSSAYSSACTLRSRALNLYIDQTKPWVLAKESTPEALVELQEVLFTLLEGIRWLATAWMSVLPFGTAEVFKQIGLNPPGESGALLALHWGSASFVPSEPKPVYPRLDLPTIPVEILPPGSH